MKCWNSTFNAQGSRIIIIIVQVKVVKIYVVAIEAPGKKEKGGQNMMKINLPQKMVHV
jgi:hypothetical protein